MKRVTFSLFFLFLNATWAYAGNTIASMATYENDVFLCAATPLNVGELLVHVRHGKVIDSVSLPADMIENFKQTTCVTSSSGMVISSTGLELYVAMADLNGQSNFGSSVLKISFKSDKMRVAGRVKLPRFGFYASNEFYDPVAMALHKSSLLVSNREGYIHRVDLESFTVSSSIAVPSPAGACDGYYSVAQAMAVDTENNISYVAISAGVGGPSSLARMSVGREIMFVEVLENAGVAGDMVLESSGRLLTGGVVELCPTFYSNFRPAVPSLLEFSVNEQSLLKKNNLSMWDQGKFYSILQTAHFLHLDLVVTVGARTPPSVRLDLVPSTLDTLLAKVTLAEGLGNASLADIVDFGKYGYSSIYSLKPSHGGSLLAIGSRPGCCDPEELLEISLPNLKIVSATKLPFIWVNSERDSLSVIIF